MEYRKADIGAQLSWSRALVLQTRGHGFDPHCSYEDDTQFMQQFDPDCNVYITGCLQKFQIFYKIHQENYANLKSLFDDLVIGSYRYQLKKDLIKPHSGPINGILQLQMLYIAGQNKGYYADMAQWSTQQPKTLSLIGCEFESHYPHNNF